MRLTFFTIVAVLCTALLTYDASGGVVFDSNGNLASWTLETTIASNDGTLTVTQGTTIVFEKGSFNDVNQSNNLVTQDWYDSGPFTTYSEMQARPTTSLARNLTDALISHLNTNSLVGNSNNQYLFATYAGNGVDPDRTTSFAMSFMETFDPQLFPSQWSYYTTAPFNTAETASTPPDPYFYAYVPQTEISSSTSNNTSATPEPSTAIAMGLLGVVGFAGNRRRRNRSQQDETSQVSES